MADDELDLGLPPKKQKAAPSTELPENYTYSKYTASDRRFCTICIQTAERINGVPLHALDKASFLEKGPEGSKWLCFKHKEERYNALVAPKKAKENQDRASQRRSKKKK